MMKTPDELKARELGTSSFAAGVIQPVEDLRSQYNRLSQLYQVDALTNSTRKNELYQAMGISPGASLPTGIQIPKGFEIEYKLVQHENDVQFKFNQYLDGQMGYDTFLYEAYGRDILKTQGHDLKNPMYWYSQRQRGITDSPIDNPVILKSLLNQAEDLFKLEEFYQRLNVPFANTSLAGINVTAETMADLFSDQEELADQLGSWEQVLTNFKAGTLMGFEPLVDTDQDGNPDYYLHTTGKLYALTEDEELARSGSYARIVRKANGDIDRISISGSDVGDWFQELWTGFVNGVTSIVDLGGLVFAAGESLITGEQYGDAYNNYLAWRNAWAPESNVYQVSKGGADDWLFGFASAAGTIAGFVALNLATAGLGNIGAGSKVATTTGGVAVKTSILKKVGTVAAKAVAKTSKTLVNLNSGIPFSGKALGVTNVLHRAAINFAVEGTEMFANAKARQAQTGLSDEAIVLRTFAASAANAALTVFLNGGTDDVGAITRLGLTKKSLKSFDLKDMNTALGSTGFGRFVMNHPRLIFAGNVITDTIENALTMGIRTTFYRTGGDFEAKDVVDGMMNPQMLFTMAFSGAMATKGFMGSEGLRTYGGIRTAQQVSKTYSDVRSTFVTRLRKAEADNNLPEVQAVRAVIAKMDNDLNSKTKDRSTTAAQIEVLNELHERNLNNVTGESFITDAFTVVAKNDVNAERLKMAGMVTAMFEQRVRLKTQAYSELLGATRTPGFLEKILNKIPVLNTGSKGAYETYSRMFNRTQNQVKMQLEIDKLASDFREDLNSIPGGEVAKEAERIVLEQTEDTARMNQRFIKPVDHINSVAEQELKNPGSGKAGSEANNRYYAALLKYFTDQGRTNPEELARNVLLSGAVFEIGMFDTTPLRSGEDQKILDAYLKAYELIEANQDQDFPHLIKVESGQNKATYIITGDLDMDVAKRQLLVNKFVAAVQLIRKNNESDAPSFASIDAAIKLMAAANLRLDETEIKPAEIVKTLQQIANAGLMSTKEIARYINESDALRFYVKQNEAEYPGVEFVKYTNALDLVNKLNQFKTLIEKVGPQKQLVKQYGEILKDLEKTGMLETLVKDNELSVKEGEILSEMFKKNFQQLLGFLKDERDLLTSSSTERTADKVISYLVKKFSDDNTLEIIKVIEQEVMTGSSSAERLILGELRQRLGDDEFEVIIRSLVDEGIIETRELERVPNFDDLAEALAGRLNKKEIAALKRKFAAARKSSLETFVSTIDKEANMQEALFKLGYYKKNQDGTFVRTLKEPSFEKLIAELETLRATDDNVEKFLNKIDQVVTQRKNAEIFYEAFKKQFPNVDISDLRKNQSYLGQLLISIGMYDNGDQSRNINPYDNIYYNNRIKFYEWLLEEDHLEKFFAIDTEKMVDGVRVDLKEFEKLIPEDFRDYINLFNQRNRIETISGGSKNTYDANPLEFSRKAFEDILKITKAQGEIKKGFDSTQWNQDSDEIETTFTLTAKQVYEESIRESKKIPTTRDQVYDVLQDTELTNIVMTGLYDRMNADTITILQPQRIVDALISSAKEYESLIGAFETSGKVEKKKILKKRINQLLKGKIQEKTIQAALDNYFKDDEGTGSFYEYAELKNIKTQTAVELETFYNKYVSYMFDDTNEIETNDVIIQINLRDIRPKTEAALELALSYQNKGQATVKDVKDLKDSMGVSDYELARQIIDSNRILRFFEGSNPIVQFNLTSEADNLKKFLNFFGYSFRDLQNTNFEGVVGISALKPGARGFQLDGRFVPKETLKLIEPNIAENIDLAKQLFVAFHGITWMTDDTVINPKDMLGNYVVYGEDSELVNGLVNVMFDELLGKLGKAGSLKDGATLSEMFTGLNVTGNVDMNLKNFMTVEWLYNTIEKYVGTSAGLSAIAPTFLKINEEEAARISRHGWQLVKSEGGYTITGYIKPKEINIKAGENILLNEIIPSEYELKLTEGPGILNKVLEIFDEQQTTLMTPSDFAFLKQDFDGRFEVLERVKNKEFNLEFSRNLNNKPIKLRKNITIKNAKAMLEGNESTRAVMLLNTLNAVTKVSEQVQARLIEVTPENVDIIKVAKLMQNEDFIDAFVKRLRSLDKKSFSDSDVQSLNSTIKGLTVPEAYSGEINYAYNRGFASSRFDEAAVMTGQEFKLLNPRVSYDDMELTKEEADYIANRLNSVFTAFNPNDLVVRDVESELSATLAQFVFEDSKGNYHLGVGAAEYFFMYDFDEQLRRIINNDKIFIPLQKKMTMLREMYPQARNKIQPTTFTQAKFSQVTPSLDVNEYSKILQTQLDDPSLITAPDANRLRSNDLYNSRHKFIKASQAQNRITNEYNGLFKNMMDYQSELVSTKVSEPSASMVVNMKNQLATGEMIRTIDDIAMTIRENGIVKPFGKQISEDAIFDLATEIYMLSNNNFRQSEYTKYLIVRTDEMQIKKIKDVNGKMIDDPEGRMEIAKFYASYMKDGQEESLIDLYATLRELDPSKEYAVFVLDRSEYLAGKANAEDGATLRVINFRDYDKATNNSKGYDMFRQMAIQTLRMGKEMASKDMDTTGSAESFIKLALANKQSKARLINNYKKYLTKNTSINEDQINAYFYNFMDTDVTAPFRNSNEEAFYRTLYKTTEEQLYDKDENNYTKRVFGLIKSGINIDDFNEADEFKLQLFKNYIEHEHKDYVQGIIDGNKVNLKLEDNPEDIAKLVNIFKDYMLRADDLQAIKFIIKSSYDENVSLREYASRRSALVKDAEYNGYKLGDIADYNKVYFDMETIVPNKGIDKDVYPFQIGLVHEYNGKIVATEEININVFEYQNLIADPDYSGFKRFIDGKERLSNKIKNAPKVSRSDAVDKILDFIEKAKQNETKSGKKDVLLVAHNGSEADFKWLEDMFNKENRINEYLNLKPNMIDTYEIIMKYPIVGFNDRNALETIKHNMDALSELSFLQQDIENFKNDTRFKIQNRDHDAKDDAGLLSVVGRHLFNPNNFLSMDVFNTNLLTKLKTITDDLGMNLSNERFSEIINDISDEFKFNIDKDGFTDKVNSIKDLNDIELKSIVDALNDYQLTMDNIYSRKRIYDAYGQSIRETQTLREALRNRGSSTLNRIVSYVISNFNDAPLLKTNMLDDDQVKLQQVLNNIFKYSKSTYGEDSRANNSMLDRMIVQMLDDGDNGLKLFIDTLNKNIPSDLIKKPFDVTEANNYAPGSYSFSNAVNNLKANPESYISKQLNDAVITTAGNNLANGIRKLENELFPANKIIDTKGGDYRNLLLRNLFTILNDNQNIINKENFDYTSINKRLNTEKISSKFSEMIEDYIKNGIPYHQLSMKRYWGLVTAFNRSEADGTYKLIDKNGNEQRFNKLSAGSIIVSEKIFKTMFGMDETKYRSNLKLEENENLYLTLLRYPADKIDPLYGYNVVVDYGAPGEDFIKMTPSDIQRHSGDFDGDKVVLVKPTIETQNYYKQGMLDLMNKPYAILEDLKDVVETDSYFAKSKEKYFSRVELSQVLANNIESDLDKLNQGANYNRLLDERIQQARGLFKNKKLKKLFEDAGYTIDTIKDLVKESWIERIDLGYLQQGKQTFLVNNLYSDVGRTPESLRFLQQKLAFDIINFKDSVTGYIQKIYSAMPDKEFYFFNKDFDGTKLQYRSIQIPSFIKEALQSQINTGKTEKIIDVLRQQVNPKIFEQLQLDDLQGDAGLMKITAALNLQEATIRTSPEFEKTLAEGFKVSGNQDIAVKNKEAIDIYEDITRGTLDDAWINFGNSYNSIVNNLFENMVRTNNETRTKVLSVDDMLQMVNKEDKYIIFDRNMTTEKGSALLNKEYAENNPTYRYFSFNKSELPNEYKNYTKRNDFVAEANGRIYFSQKENLSTNVKFASLGNETLFKSTVANVVDRKLNNASVNGQPVDSKDIALYVSYDSFGKIPANLKGEVVKIKTLTFDGQEVEYDAIKTNLSVVENRNADPDFLKTTDLDMLVVSHAKNTALEPVMFGDVYLKYNAEQDKIVVDQKLSYDLKHLRDGLNDPLLIGNDATGLYYNLILNTTLSTILNDKNLSKAIPTEERNKLREQLSIHQMEASYKNNNIINASLGLIEKYFGNKYFDDERTPQQRFHASLTPTQRKLFSFDLYRKIHPTIVTSVKDYDALEAKLNSDGPESLISSKASKLPILEEKGDGLLESFGYATSDMLLDTSKGFITQPGYISKLDFINYFADKQITKNEIRTLYKEGLLERGVGLKATYESNWLPQNIEDTRQRLNLEDPTGKGSKAGSNNANPGVRFLLNPSGFDFKKEIDYSNNTFRDTGESYLPKQSKAINFMSKTKGDIIYRNNYGALLNRLAVSATEYDNELDRVTDYDVTQPKFVSFYKNPKQIVFDDEGNIDFKYSYAPKFEGTLGQTMKFVNDNSLTSFGYNVRRQSDVSSRISNFESEVFRTLDFTPDEEVTPEFLTSLSLHVARNHQQEILESEYAEEQVRTNRMYKAEHEPLASNLIKMKKDLLATSGIGGTGEYDVKLQHAVTRLARDQKMIYADLMSSVTLLKSLVKNKVDAKAFNDYMMMKQYNWLLIESSKDATQRETVLQRLASDTGIKSEQELQSKILEYSNSHLKEASLANMFVQRVVEMGETVAKETDQVSPKIFQILRPIRKANFKENKSSYVHTLKTMFNIGPDIKNDTIDKYLPNTEFNFFHSMDTIVDSIAKIKAAKNLSDNLKDVGALDNATFMEQSRNIFDDEFSKMIEDPNKARQRRQLFDHVEGMLGNKFVIDKNSETSLFKLYQQIQKEILETNDGQNIQYKNIDELRRYADDTGDVVAKDLLTYEELLEDIKYEAVIENPEMQKRIIERVRSIAESNDASLVNEYGQLFPTSNVDNLFKPIGNFDTSFLINNLRFIQSGETYEQRLALAAMTGRLYMMDKTTAEHLNKNFFTSKVPSRTFKFLNDISKQSTKLIMSSLPQLANRMFNFSMFDYGIMATVDPGFVTKVPRSLREFSALMQSNGKILESSEYNDLKEFIGVVGLDPTKMQGLDIVQFQEQVKTPKFLNGYFNFTDKALQAQTLATRYALYLHIKESFDNGKGVYGSAYFKKDGIDALPTNSAKAIMIVDETLGSPGAFPFAAKYLQGWAMFATFPLALIRYGVNNTRTIGRVMKEIYMGEVGNEGIKQLTKSAVGLTGVALLTNLMVTLVSDIFGVDEETEEEWKKDQVLFKPLQTLLFGRPYVQYGQSANPLQSLEEMFVEPFTAKDNDTLIKKLTGIVNTNILGKLNPLFKVPAEIIANRDFFGPTPIPTQYTWEDNLARKLSGYVIGIGGANAMIDQWRFSRVDMEDPTFVDRLGASMKAAFVGEIGNNKGYKSELKNYYNAMSIVNGYRAIENKKLYGDQLNSSGFDSDVSFKLAKDIRKAMNNEQRPSVVYGLINEAIQNGAGKNEILYALRSNSILGRLSQIRNPQDFYENLSDKERVILDDAVLHENKNYSILKELLQETSQSSYSNKYVRNYVPRVYQNQQRDPRYIYNPRYYPPRTDYKPKKPLAQLQRRNMFVPRLSDATGSRAPGITAKLKVQTSPQSFVGLMNGMAIRKPYQNRIARSLRPRVRAQETPKVFDHRKVFKE